LNEPEQRPALRTGCIPRRLRWLNDDFAATDRTGVRLALRRSGRDNVAHSSGHAETGRAFGEFKLNRPTLNSTPDHITQAMAINRCHLACLASAKRISALNRATLRQSPYQDFYRRSSAR